jgi:hypothetical protein
MRGPPKKGDAPSRHSSGRQDATDHGNDRAHRQNTGLEHVRDLLLEVLSELDDGLVGAVTEAQSPYSILLEQVDARLRP